MNIVLDNTVDEKSHTDIGMVVSLPVLWCCLNSTLPVAQPLILCSAGDSGKQYSDCGGAGAIVIS